MTDPLRAPGTDDDVDLPEDRRTLLLVYAAALLCLGIGLVILSGRLS